MLLQTERLYLRRLKPDDAASFYALNEDPEVLKYTGDVPFRDIKAAEKFLQNYAQYRKYGVGRWAVIDNKTDDFLGWCGLRYTAARDEYDLGFRFFRKYWNQGYATEAARASLHLGFTKYNLKKVVGRAAAANVASVRVLEKVGMRRQGAFDFEGRAGVLYAIEQEEYADLVK